MASRNLKHLHFNLRPLAKMFLDKCKDSGLDILVTCTYRSDKEQDELYEIGRTKKGSIVTNAKGGQSEHNFTINSLPASKAFDIVPLFNGKCDWHVNSDRWKKVSDIWSDGFIYDGFYLDWYGKKGSQFLEYPHFCLKEVSVK